MPHCSINDITLFYQETGKGEPLIFLHGLGSRAEDWEFQVSHFAKSYRVITIDCRGHGQSSKPSGKYTIPLFAHDIFALIDKLELGKVRLAGLSMGGMIAFQMAVDHPSKVKSLIIINSAPAIPYDSWALKVKVNLRLFMIHFLGMAKLGEIIGKKMFPKPSQKHLVDQFVQTMTTNDKSAYIRSLKSFLGWSVIDKLAKLTMPVLVIAAEHDYSPVETKEMYCKLIKNAKLVVIPDSYHASPVDSPNLVNDAISQFLKEKSAQESVPNL